MVRGIEKKNIFIDKEDRGALIARMRLLAKETGTRILAWALLDNHVHLLLFSGQSGLPTFMRRLLTGYAVRFNRKYQRAGHLFQKAIQAYREFIEAGKNLEKRPELTGGGLIRSLGGWSRVLSLRRQGEREAYDEREMGLSLAEIARQLGVGTTGIAMSIKGLEVEKNN
jgi:REP element-mobilizing transposase RayT